MRGRPPHREASYSRDLPAVLPLEVLIDEKVAARAGRRANDG